MEHNNTLSDILAERRKQDAEDLEHDILIIIERTISELNARYHLVPREQNRPLLVQDTSDSSLPKETQ